MISQSLKKSENFFEIKPLGENNKDKNRPHQSFEDFKNKVLLQNNNKNNESLSNFMNSIKKKDENNLVFVKDNIVDRIQENFYLKNFDSATKNPMESESEEIEKNMVGSPIIEKSSRNYYASSKIQTNIYNREHLKL